VGLVGEQNVTNHIGVRTNLTSTIPTSYTRPQVQDAECAGYCTDTFPSVCNVRQTLTVEVSTSGA